MNAISVKCNTSISQDTFQLSLFEAHNPGLPYKRKNELPKLYCSFFDNFQVKAFILDWNFV